MSFAEYIQHGWVLCEIPPGTKGPRMPGWQLRENGLRDPGPLVRGAGLCHAWSGTCAIDIDHYEVAREWLGERGVDLDALLMSPESVQISSGRQGRAKLIYALPVPLPSVKVAPYQKLNPKTNKQETYHALEFRCASKGGLTVQDVLPPTIHPETGNPYEWRYGDDLVGHWSCLADLPASLHLLWEADIAPVVPEGTTVAPLGAEFDTIRRVINKRDPDCTYDDWLKVGIAVHHETQGSPEGLALWDEWSRKGGKYGTSSDGKPPQYPADKWRTFRYDAKNPITLASLLSEEVASLEEFPTVEPDSESPPVKGPDYGVDTRPNSVMRNLLEPRLVFVAGQDCYYDLGARAEAWLTDRGVRHMFCPHMPLVLLQGKNGKPDKSITPDPVDFLKNSKTKTICDAVGLHPGESRLYSEDGVRYVNRYSPFKVEPLKPKPHEMEAFNFIWGRMKDATFRNWLKKFYAHALQKPGIKIQSAPLLFGAETGTGKNTLMNEIPQLLYGARWVKLMTGNVLGGQFNDKLGDAWWLYLEELRSGSNKAERVQVANKMKAWITDSFVEVHPKGLKPFDVRNRVQITATSNFTDAVQLDNNDRRWAVCEMADPFSERESLDLYTFLRSERAAGVLRYLFGNESLTGFSPTARAPVTSSKQTMISAGLGAWESALVERMVAREHPFEREIFQLKTVHEQMVGSTPTSMNMMARMLKGPPFYCRLLPNSSKMKLWAWMNPDRWARATEGERMSHMETGERPPGGAWANEPPAALVSLSAEGSAEIAPALDVSAYPDSCNDLL